MYANEYGKMYNFEDKYWWFLGRKSVIRSIINILYKGREGLKILDVGCGTGSIMNMLAEYGDVLGADLSDTALEFCRKRGINKLLKTSADDLKLESESYDLITAFDILEHLEDDTKTLKEFHRVCRTGGHILATVPSYNFLWSEHDRILGHKRRYLRKQLRRRITSAGFRIKKISYFITFLMPAIAFFRIFQKWLKKKGGTETDYIMPPVFLNNVFIFLLLIESIFIKYIDRINFIHFSSRPAV